MKLADVISEVMPRRLRFGRVGELVKTDVQLLRSAMRIKIVDACSSVFLRYVCHYNVKSLLFLEH